MIIDIWLNRDFMPSRSSSGLAAAVDVVNIEPAKIKAVHGKRTWEADLRFTYYLENDHPNKGSRYHSVQEGPEWPVGDRIDVFVLVGGRWIYAGKFTIGSTH